MNIINLGQVPFESTFALQRQHVQEVVNGGEDRLLICEHLPVITLGRNSHARNLFISPQELEARGIALLTIDRGGDVTLHSPGQTVLYPIIDLKRAGLGLKEYLRNLEQVAVDFLKTFGIVATGDDSYRGVWVGPRKIASIGIGVSRWVTYHGMALNVDNDLGLFRLIRPCGLDVSMISMQECGAQISSSIAANDIQHHFKRVFKW